MNYQDNPTWRMLEEAKMQINGLLNEIPQWHPYYKVINECHRAMVKLQLEVENKICQDL